MLLLKVFVINRNVTVNPIRPGSRQIDACCVKIYAIFERFTAVAPYFMTFSF